MVSAAIVAQAPRPGPLRNPNGRRHRTPPPRPAGNRFETTGCAGASCHVGGPSAPRREMADWGDLNMESLFCVGQPYVDPGNPNNSAVYLKLLPDGMRDNCAGAQMPSGRQLPTEDVDCIRQWIEGMQ